MTEARLVVDLPEGPWVADVSRAHPDVTFESLASVPGDDSGFALVYLTGPDVEAVLSDMRDHGTIRELSVLQRNDREATVQLETAAPLLLQAAKASGLPIEMPVEIEAGEATVDVAGAHDRLAEPGRQFDRLGLDFRVSTSRSGSGRASC
jgi:hypothetical protein